MEYICALADDDEDSNSCFLQEINKIKELHAALAKRMGDSGSQPEINKIKKLHADKPFWQ
jgi:hypothetical protein